MKKYMLLILFLIIVVAVASPVSAGGRGRGRGHGGHGGGACYRQAERWGNPGLHRGWYKQRYRAYPAYGYYQPAPVYVAPAPVYVYPAYPAYPPPPPVVYEPYYDGPRVRGHVGVDIVF
jgi:hypothetical protein